MTKSGTFLFAILTLTIFGCAGYRVGNDALYRKDIRTVHIPIFESESFRRGLGERLTEAVAKRLEARSNYKVVGRVSADSILYGRITSESQNITSSNDYGDSRQKRTAMSVEIQWIDRRSGTQIRNFSITADSQSVAEFGHSLSTAQQEAIDRLADQIVETMETPW